MTHKEKIIEYKDIIYKLYSIEGRNKSYISRLLDVHRGELTKQINSWGFEKAQKKHLTPSNQKFLNKNRNKIKSMLDSDQNLQTIADHFNVKLEYLTQTIIPADSVLIKSNSDNDS